MSAKSEKYKSKSQMRRHEITEGSKERKMEYGSAKHPGFKAVAANPRLKRVTGVKKGK